MKICFERPARFYPFKLAVSQKKCVGDCAEKISPVQFELFTAK